MATPSNTGPKGSDSKLWMGILAFFVVLALLGPTLLFRISEPEQKQEDDAIRDAVHTTHGVLEFINAAERRVTIAHDEIPNVMPAMTMPFTVPDAQFLDGLAKGDHVEFSFRLRDRAAWIEEIHKEPAESAH